MLKPVTVPATTTKSPGSKAKIAGKATSTPATLPAAAPVATTVPPVAAVAKRAPVKKTRPAAEARPAVTPDMRRGMIAKAAYLRSERRGFASGHEDEDWLAAEAEVDQLLSADLNAPQ
jgi:hypothetical protein